MDQAERTAYKKEIEYHRENFLKLNFLLQNVGNEKGEWAFVHPYKFYDLVNKNTATFVDVYKAMDLETPDYLLVCGQKYIQTTLVPRQRTVYTNWRGPFLSVEFYEEYLNEERAKADVTVGTAGQS